MPFAHPCIICAILQNVAQCSLMPVRPPRCRHKRLRIDLQRDADWLPRRDHRMKRCEEICWITRMQPETLFHIHDIITLIDLLPAERYFRRSSTSLRKRALQCSSALCSDVRLDRREASAHPARRSSVSRRSWTLISVSEHLLCAGNVNAGDRLQHILIKRTDLIAVPVLGYRCRAFPST